VLGLCLAWAAAGAKGQTPAQNPAATQAPPATQDVQAQTSGTQDAQPNAQNPPTKGQNPPQGAEPATEVGPPALTIPRLTRGPSLEDFLGMKPAGEVALQMAKVTGFVQRNPHDGEAVSENTEAYLGYDQKNLYVVFVCFDDPKKVRARMSRREDIYDDDEVEVMLDTFHDRRRAYAFQTTPLGVQWDAIWTEASREEQTQGNWDISWDTVWDSRGKVTDRGFVVWLSIPFKSLRFPAAKSQEWGIILYRGIFRKNEDSFWPHISYKMQGRLGQAATLYGLEGISPGRSIELIPYGVMRGFRGLDTHDPTPFFRSANVQGQPGMDSKFVLHDHFVLDLTANPDFSQVESEDPQITVNQRFEVYFPEKRPFFLENEDYFRTPIDLFFTRNIQDPSAGIRLTGKEGPYSVGLMTTDDRGAGLAVPDTSPLLGVRSYFTIARASRDLFKQSSVGALYTDWECPESGEYNRVGGVDTRLHLSSTWTLEGQGVVSSSHLLGNAFSSTYSGNNCEIGVFPFSSGNVGHGSYYAGPADKLDLKRDALHFSYEAIYSDISPGFVTVPGFVNRADIRYAWQDADYRFRPKKGWVVDWGPSFVNRYVFDHSGTRLDTDYAPYLAVQGRGQTYIFLYPYEELRERLRPQDFFALAQNQDYHEHSSGASIQTSYFPKLMLLASYRWGDGINFVPATGAPFLAHTEIATALLTFRPIKPLKIENTYLFERLRATDSDYQQTLLRLGLPPGTLGRSIFNDHILRSKWNWQFTPKLSLRVILQYNALLANTPGNTVYPYTFLPTQKQFNTDFLITYLVHPGTAIYAGYNSDLQNIDHNLAFDPAGLAGLFTASGLINDSRQFFVKVSYQFRF